jgi:hypothetical protein
VWTFPERVDPPYDGDERLLLESWLDWHRGTLLAKCAGLPAAALVERAVPPSSLTLAGLVRHLTDVERYWLRQDWEPGVTPVYWPPSGSAEPDFEQVGAARVDADLDVYLREVAACRAAAAARSLDDTVVKVRGGVPETISLRWVLIHLVEEYARHNGHADLLRERLDGAVGE